MATIKNKNFMLFNEDEFLKTELGKSLKESALCLNIYLNDLSKAAYLGSTYSFLKEKVNSYKSQVDIILIAILQFYGIKYDFVRTEDYYGICTSDGKFLFKFKVRP